MFQVTMAALKPVEGVDNSHQVFVLVLFEMMFMVQVDAVLPSAMAQVEALISKVGYGSASEGYGYRCETCSERLEKASGRLIPSWVYINLMLSHRRC